MSIQGVIEKVQKLRKLARSTNEHEAAAAAAAADRLIQEHGLVEAQLQAEGKVEAEPVAEEKDPLTVWRGRAPTWQRQLASGLTRHYDCAAYLSWDYEHRTSTGGPGLRHNLVGRASDVAAVRYMYGWLSVEIERLAQTHKGSGRSWLDSFRRGAVQGVLNKLYASKKAARGEVEARVAVASAIDPGTKAGAGLVLYDRRREEAVETMKSLHEEVAERMKRSRGGRSFASPSEWSAYRQGQEEGRSIHVGASIGGGKATKALGGGS